MSVRHAVKPENQEHTTHEKNGKRVCIIRQRAYYELPVRREAEALLNAGYDVDLICLQDEGHENEEMDNGVQIYRIPLRLSKGSVIRYLQEYFSFFIQAMIKLTTLHFKKRYDVIQVNTMPDFLVFAQEFRG